MGRQGRSRGPRGARSQGPRIFWGRVVCVVGLISVLWGVSHISITYDFLGVVLGVVGYALGARRLGAATVLISVVALVFSLAASQGLIPGIEPADPRSSVLDPLR